MLSWLTQSGAKMPRTNRCWVVPKGARARDPMKSRFVAARQNKPSAPAFGAARLRTQKGLLENSNSSFPLTRVTRKLTSVILRTDFCHTIQSLAAAINYYLFGSKLVLSDSNALELTYVLRVIKCPLEEGIGQCNWKSNYNEYFQNRVVKYNCELKSHICFTNSNFKYEI